MEADTFGSNFNTTIGVYDGPSVNALSKFASNDDAGGTQQSQVYLSVNAGTTYDISVDGYGASEGNVQLNVSESVAAPAITSFTPTSGPAGTGVTITGSGFAPTSSVAFNGTAAAFMVKSDAQITATVPAGATTGPITVTNPSATATSAGSFTVVAPAMLTALSPSSATAGGAAFPLTITGTNFVSGATVDWNGTALSTTFGSSTSLTASVPASDIAAAGSDSVTVVNPGVAASNALTFTVNAGIPANVAVGMVPNLNAGAVFSVTATVTDSGANPVPNASVILELNGPGTLLGGTTSGTTNSSGQFTFSGLTIGTQGEYEITVLSGSASGSSNTFTVAAGTAAGVTVNMVASQVAGADLAVSGTVNDAYGNALPNQSAVLTLNGPGTLMGGPTSRTTNGSGQFVFNGISITTAGSGYTFTVTSGSISGTSNAFNITAGAASNIGVGTISSQVAGKPFSVTVTVTDAFANPVANAGVSLMLNGTGSLNGVISSATNNSGQATFTGLTISAAGTGDTITATSSAVAATSNAFTVTPAPPAITKFSPVKGIAGQGVIITGTGFTGATAVKFNGKAASYTVNSDAQITTYAPQGGTAGPLSVTTGAGTGTSTGYFTYQTAPTFTGLSPHYGPVGTAVTLTGTGLTNITAVEFNGLAASFTASADGTSITATVPTGATTGPISLLHGPVVIAASSTNFTVTTLPAAHLSSLSPASVAAGNAAFTLYVTGTGFVNGAVVNWNGSARATTFMSSTQVKAVIHASDVTASGSVTVTVVNPGAAASNALTFTITVPAPTITSFFPTSGPVGTGVTITGAHLNGVSSIRFIGANATTFSVNAAGTQVTVTVPTGAHSGYIKVTTPGGMAQSSGNFTITP